MPLAAVDIAGKMGYSDAQRQTKEPRMDIAAEFMTAIINAFEANKRLADRAVEPGELHHYSREKALLQADTEHLEEVVIVPAGVLPLARNAASCCLLPVQQ